MKKALNLFGITLLVVVFLASCPQPTSNNGSPIIDTDIPQDEITKLTLIASEDMSVADTQQLHITLRTTSGVEYDYTKKVKWIVSEDGEEHLSINDKGVATANSVATVTVRAEYKDELSNPVEITITQLDEIKSLTLIAREDMSVGDTQELRVIVRTASDAEHDYTKKVKWIVSKGGEEHLSIDDKDIATANSVATVTVSAEYKGIFSNLVAITITQLVETPIISPDAEYIKNNQEITITTTTSDAKIYYTTDNSQPSSSSTPYDAENKLIISETTTIKAIAVRKDLSDSEVTTKAFITDTTLPNIDAVSMTIDDDGKTLTVTGASDNESGIASYAVTVKIGDTEVAGGKWNDTVYTHNGKITSSTNAALTYTVTVTDKVGNVSVEGKGVAKGSGGGWAYYDAGATKGWHEISEELKESYTWENAKIAATEYNGSSGWKLPNRGELNAAYESLYKGGTPLSSTRSEYLWSSTPIPQSSAWTQTFAGGREDPSPRENPKLIRAVRAFTPLTFLKDF